MAKIKELAEQHLLGIVKTKGWDSAEKLLQNRQYLAQARDKFLLSPVVRQFDQKSNDLIRTAETNPGGATKEQMLKIREQMSRTGKNVNEKYKGFALKSASLTLYQS